MTGLKIDVFSQNVPLPQLNKNDLKKVLTKLIINERVDFSFGTLNIVICDDDYLHKLNVKFLHHNFLTDVITFDYSDHDFLSGEIYVSSDRVMENAKKFSQPYKTELIRVIIHGFLHICGYKDKNTKEKLQMTQKEDFYLGLYKNIGRKNDNKK